MTIDFSIDNTNHSTIQSSFDRIANELILNWSLQVNDNLYDFIEIEFYYYDEKIHPDDSAHDHKREVGKWRMHPSGLDISLGNGIGWDGGILIRGIKSGTVATNGPRKVVWEILNQFDNVFALEKKFGLVERKYFPIPEIHTSPRIRLGVKTPEVYKQKPYRYFVEKND